MPILKLIKGRSYTGCGVNVTQKNPITGEIDEAIAARLVNTGYFRMEENVAAGPTNPAVTIGETDAPNPASTTGEQSDPDFEKMTREEVDKYAADAGLDTRAAKNKAEAIKMIIGAL